MIVSIIIVRKVCAIHNLSILSIRYSTIETKEAARIENNGFLFPHSYSAEGLSMNAEKETRYIQYGQILLFQ